MVKGKDLRMHKRLRGKGVILLVASLILSGWSVPVNISNSAPNSNFPAICSDRRGWLHVVWEENVGSVWGLNDIYYACRVDSVWTLPLNVSNDSFASWRPDVAVDTLNRVHVVWGNYETGKIMWTMCEDGVWTTPVSISDSVPYACVAPEIAVNPLDNAVHCVWHDLGSATTDAEIWHTYFDGETWSVPENVTNDTYDSGWPDIAIDSLGRIHLVWMDYGTEDIFYSCWDGTTWSSPVNISNLSGQSCAPRIAIDRDNNPHVVWEERENGYEVYYTYFDGTRWVVPVLVDIDYSRSPVIAVDKNNRVHVAWTHTNGTSNIFYTVYTDTVREFPPENASNTDSSSGIACVVVDTQLAHLIWVDNSEGGSSFFKNWEIYYSRRELLGIGERNKEPSFSFPSIAIYKLFFTFSLTKSSFVTLSVYDLAGRKVKEVSLGFKGEGTHECRIPLDLPSGVYFPILKADTQIFRGKIIFINP